MFRVSFVFCYETDVKNISDFYHLAKWHFGNDTALLGCEIIQTNEIYQHLPKGAKWFLKGANFPSLRVESAPLGGCW